MQLCFLGEKLFYESRIFCTAGNDTWLNAGNNEHILLCKTIFVLEGCFYCYA